MSKVCEYLEEIISTLVNALGNVLVYTWFNVDFFTDVFVPNLFFQNLFYFVTHSSLTNYLQKNHS